jgi:hypothetical protein
VIDDTPRDTDGSGRRAVPGHRVAAAYCVAGFGKFLPEVAR